MHLLLALSMASADTNDQLCTEESISSIWQEQKYLDTPAPLSSAVSRCTTYYLDNSGDLCCNASTYTLIEQAWTRGREEIDKAVSEADKKDREAANAKLKSALRHLDGLPQHPSRANR